MVLVALWILANTSAAAPPAFEDVEVGGIELLPQSLFGAALFIFEVDGRIDGRPRSGWGWIAVNHVPLEEIENFETDILGGEGEIWIGLRRYEVHVTGGELVLLDSKDPAIFDDLFAVRIEADLCRRAFFWTPLECAPHVFEGLLDHEPFPPTIGGVLDEADD
jgi:hypothetical protein